VASAVPPEGRRTGTVVLRPEQLRLADADTAGVVTGTVTDVCFYGHDAKVTVAVPGLDHPVDVRVAGPSQVGPGRRTGVRVTGEATLHP
jgi:iron(III) transport system ATP-binding protein